MRIRGLQWRCAGEIKPFTTVFHRCDRTLAVSPFVDTAGCSGIFARRDVDRLLTTVPAAADLDANVHAKIMVAETPLQLPPMPVAPPEAAPVGETPEPPEPRGLHAKLVLRRGGTRARLWIGSANLTGRGMLGPNAEVLAELDIPETIANALATFIDDSEEFSGSDENPTEKERRKAERELDKAIEAVLAAEFTLARTKDGLRLTAKVPLDAFLANHRLKVWLLTLPDTPVPWPSGASSVQLVPAVPTGLETVLVCFSAERLAGDCLPRQWAQMVSFPGHDADARDHAARASYVGLAGASAWLRAQLLGIVPAEHVTWTGAHRWSSSGHPDSGTALPLTLEEILAAWARNPDQFEMRARGLEDMLNALGEEIGRAEEDEPDPEALAQWLEVEAFWRTIIETIGPDDGA
ncbi:MAG TPA: hypothetical protein DD670_03780 [Planctomycetaceae bacterium]|nr:hypothetical protein [Planctomycetaceae bacterium]